MKYELNRSYNRGGVVYVLKARYLDQHDSMLGREALFVLANLSSLMATKMNEPILHMRG